MKKALITGVTGQDGAFLAQKLLARGYEVIGTVRRGSTPKTGRLLKLGIEDKVKLVAMEMTELANVMQVLRNERPDYIYNLAAQSFVADSFTHPHLTTEVDYIGYLNILESVRINDIDCAVYQASTSEMYGDVISDPQNEDTPFNPMSPYAIAKAAAHYLSRNYRAAYGIRASNGILFNHESELRGREFVTRKITARLALIKEHGAEAVKLGNMDSMRDWGYAPDYVEGMILIAEATQASDYVIATNRVLTVREFFKAAAIAAGFAPVFEGSGLDEKCICQKTNRVLCEVDSKYFRPSDVTYLRGDYSKIEKELGWKPTTTLEEMTMRMVESDIELAQRGMLYTF